MESLKGLEKQIEGWFKNAPPLPRNAKDTLVKILPWLALIFGILQIIVAVTLFQAARTTSVLIDYANELSRTYGGQSVGLSSMDKTIIYLGIIILVVDAVIALMAYPHLVKRARRGWDLLFLGAVINVVYAVVSLFMDGRGIGSFIFSLLWSAIGFYLLFQIKASYVKASK